MEYDKDLFRGKTIALVGDFGDKYKHSTLGHVIRDHGGVCSLDLDPSVTHLVCSKDAWDSNDPAVQMAQRYPKIQIVTVFWLLNCLADNLIEPESKHTMDVFNDRAAALHDERQNVVAKVFEDKGYSETLLRALEEMDSCSQLPDEQFLEGTEAACRELDSDQYHYYRDDTAFTYHISLTRHDERPNTVQTFELTLFETNCGPPFYYACTASYRIYRMLDNGSVFHSDPEVYRLAQKNSEFHVAFSGWRLLFRCLTGVDWEFRSWVTPNFQVLEGRPTQDLPGTSLHARCVERAKAHQEAWKGVQERAPREVREAVTCALKGKFKYKATATPNNPRKPAMKKPKKPETPLKNDIRTGLPRAKTVKWRLTPSSSEDEAEPEAERVAEMTRGKYFQYVIPPHHEPQGDITMHMTGSMWFGDMNMCRARCMTRAHLAAAAAVPKKYLYSADAAAKPSLADMNVKVVVGGGWVSYNDWRLYKEGFQV